ncbi:hypothetical protein EVAR_82781_1 [Eumeta japonica]|uniref:Uncharacterized protein n=1 Tax=Eumeta variegata TaxID=151549 RepID=A0A4C1UP37_EUMVA|nr:hypothetical protein EVAR_82781_1 [Eumeta japonica]
MYAERAGAAPPRRTECAVFLIFGALSLRNAITIDLYSVRELTNKKENHKENLKNWTRKSATTTRSSSSVVQSIANRHRDVTVGNALKRLLPWYKVF